jgi:superfamily II DNA or RNA helicase
MSYKVGAMLSGIGSFDKLSLTSCNPKFDSRKKFGGIGTKGLPPHISFYNTLPDGTYEVPRNFGEWGQDFIDNRQVGKPISLTFNGTLREEQKWMENLDLSKDTIVNAYCSYGKTATSCYLLAKVKRQALILVPTTILSEQWATEMRKFLTSDCSMYGPDIYIVKNSSQIFETHDICIMTYVMASKMNAERLKSFGICILDELHRSFSNVWSQAITKIPAAVRIGLTATMYRSDMLEKFGKFHFKQIIPVYSPYPKGHMYFVKTNFTVNSKFIKGFTKIENEVNASKIRNERIEYILKQLIAKGRKPIVIAKRKKSLEDIVAKFPGTGGLLTSDTSKLEGTLEFLRNEANPICGISQLIKEGFDAPSADTILILTPMSMIEQVIGRVLRQLNGKKQPLILYLLDDISIYANTVSKSLDHPGHTEYKGEINWNQITNIL